MKLATHRSGRALAIAALAATTGLVIAGCSSADPGSSSSDESFTIGIVEQQLANPFFANLQQSAVAAAEEAGLDVMTAESQSAGDSATQVAAIENMIAQGVKGIVLDPANASALVDIVQRARDAGILVVTVNTSLEPADAADASFETDNLAGGALMGEWAKASLGDAEPQVAMLDYDLSDKTAGARHDGFLEGFGLTDDSPEIVGTALTESNVETGQTAMENLLSAHPDINAIYTINEPAAQGAYIAISNAGKEDQVLVTSIDGSCAGVRSVQDGEIGATVMQFPSRMGELAVEAIIDFVETGEKPSGVIDSGTTLITDDPVEGVESEDSAWGLENCWGE
ncbi:MAG TPA: sugar ABC transporter [Microbacterium sp.]|uniref:substrate-binding domain-containing protein n=1 Tax=Microbacterium sp. UBA1612 TaxID=1946942 RepID=UPI000E89FFC5|nr:substrate-binding domain-containing protein [Microbacterium sp. UBA1612]HAS31741.1 sugar ABC transporter [Microbacterium sp.]HBR88671.1 sugar ABC transporter [Microbacterium sp.]|tara:strand:- start:114506 stop:115525 length:1020 start_codon:yes stop_codon:yes gene_type:complete